MALRQASYNNVKFEVESSSLEFGRRAVLHEYPQRDTPYVEDLGKATRKLSVSGFFVGSDYVKQAQNFIKEVEKSCTTDGEQTPGKLVHPWLGSLEVIPIDTPTFEWDKQKKFCSFNIQFYEAGELNNPNKKTNFIQKVLGNADELYNKCIGAIGLDGIQDYISDIQDSISEVYDCLADNPFSKAFDLAQEIYLTADSFISSWTEGDSESCKSDLLSTIALSSYATNNMDWQNATKQSIECVTNSDFAPSSSNSVVASNTNQVKQAIRLVMLGNALGASTFIKSSQDINSDGEQTITSDENILTVRDSLLQAIDNEMLIQSTDNDDLYETLANAYSSVYQMLTNKVDDGVGSENIKLSESKPAVAVAYDRYENSARGNEIAQRNNVVNPLFLPTDTLKVSVK